MNKDPNMIGTPPSELPNGILPCGYNMRKHSFGNRLRHYSKCEHPYCQWRALAAAIISAPLQKGVQR